MSSREQKNKELAVENKDGICCPECDVLIELHEFDLMWESDNGEELKDQILEGLTDKAHYFYEHEGLIHRTTYEVAALASKDAIGEVQLEDCFIKISDLKKLMEETQ